MEKPARIPFNKSRTIVSLVLVEYLSTLELPNTVVLRYWVQTFPYAELLHWTLKHGIRVLAVVVVILSRLSKHSVLAVFAGMNVVHGWFRHYCWDFLVVNRIYVMVGLLTIFFTVNLVVQFSRVGDGEFADEMSRLNNWPAVPSYYYDLARQLFDYGDLKHAEMVLGESKAVINSYNYIGISTYFNNDARQAYDYVNQREKLRDELGEINAQLLLTPYSTYLLGRKAEIEARLMQDDELTKTLSAIKWIDPQLKINQ